MTDEEKKWMLTLVDVVEALFIENAALKTTLEHHRVSSATYEAESAELVRVARASGRGLQVYEALRDGIRQTKDLSQVVRELLKGMPTRSGRQ